jgi:hypothetical protein
MILGVFVTLTAICTLALVVVLAAGALGHDVDSDYVFGLFVACVLLAITVGAAASDAHSAAGLR